MYSCGVGLDLLVLRPQVDQLYQVFVGQIRVASSCGTVTGKEKLKHLEEK